MRGYLVPCHIHRYENTPWHAPQECVVASFERPFLGSGVMRARCGSSLRSIAYIRWKPGASHLFASPLLRTYLAWRNFCSDRAAFARANLRTSPVSKVSSSFDAPIRFASHGFDRHRRAATVSTYIQFDNFERWSSREDSRCRWLTGV